MSVTVGVSQTIIGRMRDKVCVVLLIAQIERNPLYVFFVARTAWHMDRTEYVLSVVRWKLGWRIILHD